MAGPPAPPRSSLFAMIWSFGIRLGIWYLVVTALFRCPKSLEELTIKSPRACIPILHASSFAEPYIKPYYDSYLAHHVERVRPHVEAVHANVYQPASSFVLAAYQRYGAPTIAQGRQYGGEQWERFVQPRVQLLQSQANEHYQSKLAPYVNQAQGAIVPHATRARDVATQQYQTVLLPAYEKSIPYAQQAYNQGYYVVIYYGLPYSKWAAGTVVTFFSRNVWPTIRILYGQNVEPQLSKIRERLGSYRDRTQLESFIEDTDKSIRDGPIKGTEASPASEAVSSLSTEPVSSTAAEHAIPTSETTPEPEKPTEDLRRWQVKFAKASDKGAENLNHRIAEITNRQLETAGSIGKALVDQLTTAAVSSSRTVRSTIVRVVESLGEESNDEEKSAALEKAHSSIRSAGQTVKERAQAIRSWKADFIRDTNALVEDATRNTLEVLDNVRDLGLQEIGMRWAALDDERITHDDWSQYYSLKRTFDEWREKVQKVALDHEGLAAVKTDVDDIEDHGMAIAQDSAEELARLKDVARWKVHARDYSDDFSTKLVPPAAARIGQKIVEKVKEAGESVLGSSSSQDFVQSVMSEVSEGAKEMSESASSYHAASISNPASNFLSSAAELVSPSSGTSDIVNSVFSDSIVEPVSSQLSSAHESIAPPSGAKDTIKSVASKVMSAGKRIVEISAAADLLGKSSEAASPLSSISETVRSASSILSENISGPQSSGASIISEQYEAISSQASEFAERVVEDIPGTKSFVESVVSAKSEFEEKLEPSEASSVIDAVTSMLSEAASEASDTVSRVSLDDLQLETIIPDPPQSAIIPDPPESTIIHDPPESGGYRLQSEEIVQDEDVVNEDRPAKVSESIRSRVSEAGEDFASETSKLAREL